MISNIRIVATIGPISANEKALRSFYKSGMNVARLNGSHNTLSWHRSTIRLIRRILPKVPIILDIPGNKIRTCDLSYEPNFEVNEQIILTTSKGFDGKEKISITNDILHKKLSKGQIIFADDGSLKFRIKKVKDRDIYCIALTKGKLRSKKGINVPSIKLDANVIKKRDKEMIQFALNNNLDFIGISFVESANHINIIRKLATKKGPKIVAKVENQSGMENLEEIVKATDVIMIDRGDLSTETHLETIALNQKKIINICNLHAKPVTVATEILHTMISNSQPTKAEITDISNAILDGASAIMLSGETAIGKYSNQSIKTMFEVGKVINKSIDKAINRVRNENPKGSIPLEIGKAISKICYALPITKIVTITRSGYAASLIAAQLLPQPILAVSNDRISARGFNIIRGTKGIYLSIKFRRKSLDHIIEILESLWKDKYIDNSDLILVTGLGYPFSGRRMNIIQTHYVKDLSETFKWRKKSI